MSLLLEYQKHNPEQSFDSEMLSIFLTRQMFELSVKESATPIILDAACSTIGDVLKKSDDSLSVWLETEDIACAEIGDVSAYSVPGEFPVQSAILQLARRI